jgi:alpha-ribazole phosphatase
MVKTLYLIRHGETVGGDEKRYKGSLDVPLSENGIEQVRKTAEFLKDANISNVYTSPLIRALKSAEIIAEPHGLKPIEIPDFRERSFGIWEGMSFNEIKDKYPEEFEAWAGNPLKYSPMGGESTIEVRDRVIKAMDEILNRAKEQESRRTEAFNFRASELQSFSSNIAVVAHGGVNRIILCHIMGIPLENIFRIQQDYAAVNIIEFWEKHPVVKLLNGGLIG